MGWKVDNYHDKTSIQVEQQKIPVRIKEKIKQVPHVLTDLEKGEKKRWRYSYLPKHDYLSTGELYIEIDQYNSYDQKNVWKIEETKLDEQLREFMESVWIIAQWSYESELVRGQMKIEE